MLYGPLVADVWAALDALDAGLCSGRPTDVDELERLPAGLVAPSVAAAERREAQKLGDQRESAPSR